MQEAATLKHQDRLLRVKTKEKLKPKREVHVRLRQKSPAEWLLQRAAEDLGDITVPVIADGTEGCEVGADDLGDINVPLIGTQRTPGGAATGSGDTASDFVGPGDIIVPTCEVAVPITGPTRARDSTAIAEARAMYGETGQCKRLRIHKDGSTGMAVNSAPKPKCAVINCLKFGCSGCGGLLPVPTVQDG